MKQLITELKKEEEKAIYGGGWIIVNGEVIWIYELAQPINIAITKL